MPPRKSTYSAKATANRLRQCLLKLTENSGRLMTQSWHLTEQSHELIRRAEALRAKAMLRV